MKVKNIKMLNTTAFDDNVIVNFEFDFTSDNPILNTNMKTALIKNKVLNWSVMYIFTESGTDEENIEITNFMCTDEMTSYVRQEILNDKMVRLKLLFK